MNVLTRHNVRLSGQGPGAPSIVFAHGYGCDQNVWREVAPAFEADYRVLRFDYVGAGCSDLTAYDRNKYGTLEGHARDVIELCAAAELDRPVFVGHSVSTNIGFAAARLAPDLFSGLVMVAPSPCYINQGDYVGGFEEEDIDGLLDTLDSNFFSWARMMAPLIMGNGDRPELGHTLANSFCATEPAIARHFARVTFRADHRGDLPHVRPPVLLLQCSDDVLAPQSVGRYLQGALPDATLVVLEATGHCPHLSAPEETTAAIRQFLAHRLAVA